MSEEKPILACFHRVPGFNRDQDRAFRFPRASYNGYYVSFPSLRRGFDSLRPHRPETLMVMWGFLLV